MKCSVEASRMNILALVALTAATILTPSAAVDLTHVLSDIDEAEAISQATRSVSDEPERDINACSCSSNNMKVLVTSMGGTSWRHNRT